MRMTSPRNSPTGLRASTAQRAPARRRNSSSRARPSSERSVDLVQVLERLGEQERRRLVLVRRPRRGARSCGALAQRRHARQVLEADPVARAEQDPRERHARERVGDRARVGQHLDDLGQPQQPGQADDLDRDPALAERLLQRARTAGSCGTARRSSTSWPPGPRRAARRTRSAIHRASVHSSANRRDLDLARRRSPARARAACRVRALRAGSGAMTASAAARIRAPERKFVYSGSCATAVPSARGNCSGNSQQVEQAGAAPRVDVLVGVADRGHREARRRRRRAISSACATFVSWYSSSSTAPNRVR